MNKDDYRDPQDKTQERGNQLNPKKQLNNTFLPDNVLHVEAKKYDQSMAVKNTISSFSLEIQTSKTSIPDRWNVTVEHHGEYGEAVWKESDDNNVYPWFLSCMQEVFENIPQSDKSDDATTVIKIQGIRLLNPDSESITGVINTTDTLSNVTLESDEKTTLEVAFKLIIDEIVEFQEQFLAYQVYARFHNLFTGENRLIKSDPSSHEVSHRHYYIVRLPDFSLPAGQYQLRILISASQRSSPLAIWKAPIVHVI